ncbi:unnamed protein product [Hydatigera taeniaeformis]|uniref:Mitogen-activated protein kinase kinase kinase 19 n=1 Tax=Hydatigena taeniaeformis TaxID=6205 RepID=A0A0R3X2Z8_HYDTA|nr:unnamed protein product [Hydatigera taeniaeformis]
MRASRVTAIKAKRPRKVSRKHVSHPRSRGSPTSGGTTKKGTTEPLAHESNTEKMPMPNIPKILVTLVESESWQSSSSTTQRRAPYTHSGDSMGTPGEATDTDEAVESGQMSDTLDSLECFTDPQSEMLSCNDNLRLKTQVYTTIGEVGRAYPAKVNPFTPSNSLYHKIKDTYLSDFKQNSHPTVHKCGVIPLSTKDGALPLSSHEELSWIGWNSANWHCQTTPQSTRQRNGEGVMTCLANKVDTRSIANRCNSLRHKHGFPSSQTQLYTMVDASGENDAMKVTHMSHAKPKEADLSETGSRAIISQATHTQASVNVKKEVEIGAGAECHQADREPSTVGSLSTLPPFTLPEHCTHQDCCDSPKIVCSPSHKPALAGVVTTERCNEKLTLPNDEVYLQRSELFTPEMNEYEDEKDDSTLCNDPLLILTSSEFVEIKNSTGIAPERMQRDLREDAVTIESQMPRKRMISIRTKTTIEDQKDQRTDTLDTSFYTTCLARKKCLMEERESNTASTQNYIPFSSTFVKQWSLSEESVHTTVELSPTYAMEIVITSPSSRLQQCIEKDIKAITPLTSVSVYSRTCQSAMKGEAFSAHPFNFPSHNQTTLQSGQPISLTSVSSFESELPLSGDSMATLACFKEKAERGDRLYDKIATCQSKELPSQALIHPKNENLASIKNMVEVYYDMSVCMTPAGSERRRSGSTAINVLVDLNQNTFSMADLDSSMITSEMDDITFVHDFQNVGSQKCGLKRMKRNEKCKRQIQSSQADPRRSRVLSTSKFTQKHSKMPRKIFYKASRGMQRKHQANRLPVLSLEGVAPEKIPHVGKEASTTTTETIRGSRGITEASKGIRCFKPLSRRSLSPFHLLPPKKTQSGLFDNHLAQFKRPSSWNSTIFTGPKRPFINCARIKKRQALAYEKKVHQLSAGRLLNENNNASTRIEGHWRLKWTQVELWCQNCNMMVKNTFSPYRIQSVNQFIQRMVKLTNYITLFHLFHSVLSSPITERRIAYFHQGDKVEGYEELNYVLPHVYTILYFHNQSISFKWKHYLGMKKKKTDGLTLLSPSIPPLVCLSIFPLLSNALCCQSLHVNSAPTACQQSSKSFIHLPNFDVISENQEDSVEVE